MGPAVMSGGGLAGQEGAELRDGGHQRGGEDKNSTMTTTTTTIGIFMAILLVLPSGP
jgi:hypothetical protein